MNVEYLLNERDCWYNPLKRTLHVPEPRIQEGGRRRTREGEGMEKFDHVRIWTSHCLEKCFLPIFVLHLARCVLLNLKMEPGSKFPLCYPRMNDTRIILITSVMHIRQLVQSDKLLRSLPQCKTRLYCKTYLWEESFQKNIGFVKCSNMCLPSTLQQSSLICNYSSQA